MDIFSLHKTNYNNGKIINGIETALWVERYNQECEFEITGEPTKEFLTNLALGTLISHIDSKTIMMVETHEIDETKEGPPKLKVSGRSVDWIVMENRVVTLSDEDEDDFEDDGFTGKPMEYILSLASTWAQVKILLERYLESAEFNTQEQVPNLDIVTAILTPEPVLKERVIQRLSVLSGTVSEMLTSIDAGIKVERPNSTHPTKMHFIIHDGVDRSATIRFDWNSGDLDSARYIWSNKLYKNSSYTTNGYYTLQSLRDGVFGLDLRIMPIDASDWDKFYEDPTPGDFEGVKRVLASRAIDQISKRKQMAIIDAVVSKDSRYRYGVDYNIGDLVYVLGNHDVSKKMRVIEYSRSMDETGEHGFPTLVPVD